RERRRLPARRYPGPDAPATDVLREVTDHDRAVQGASIGEAERLVVRRVHFLEVVDPPAKLAAREQRSDLCLAGVIRHFDQPVPDAAAGMDDVSAGAQRIDALEQLGARDVELVAEDSARDEVVGALEEQPEDDGILPHIGPMPLAGRCEGSGHQAPSTIRLRSTAGAECVRAPTDT